MWTALIESIASERGALGILLAASVFVIRYLLKERSRLVRDLESSRKELRQTMLEQLRNTQQFNADLNARLETMRGLRDRITSRKVVLHESER